MKKFNIFTVISAAALLSACGSSSTRDFTSGGLNSTSSNNTYSSSGTGTQSGNYLNLPAAPEFTAKISGAGGPSPSAVFPPAGSTSTLSTSATLRVKVTPLAAPHLTISPYTNWVFPYGCLRLQVHVNGTTQVTQVLRVGNVAQGANSQCANAPTSQILDFRNAITGSGSVTVTVDSAEYDQCRYYNPLNYGCSMSAVWLNHMTAAQIAIQTDGFWLE